MGTSASQIKEWFDRAKKEGATHLIVVCDTYDYDDYPVSVMPGQDVEQEVRKRSGHNMQRVMEVYCLAKPFDQQTLRGEGARPDLCWDMSTATDLTKRQTVVTPDGLCHFATSVMTYTNPTTRSAHPVCYGVLDHLSDAPLFFDIGDHVVTCLRCLDGD